MGGYVRFPDDILSKLYAVGIGNTISVPGSFERIKNICSLNKPIMFHNSVVFETPFYIDFVVSEKEGREIVLSKIVKLNDLFVSFTFRVNDEDECIIAID